MKNFKGLPVLKETTADKVDLPEIIIKPDMEVYSGWDYANHLNWIFDCTGLSIPLGSIIATDESCSAVWLLSRDFYKTKCRLIYREVE